ncbi:MAG: glycine cleavage system protein GcvH [Candidatus Omnitrophica bacterium]|nr:glycine cleavage system protein GcvH [Candidatus Omnitrophota bacterium]
MAKAESLKFTKTHEWIHVEGARGVVGITKHAQEEISDVVFVELPKTGTQIGAGQEAAVVESVKAAFSIYAPVSGKVAQVNDRLSKDPALINSSPLDDGWIFALEIQDPKEISGLMSLDQYNRWVTQEKDGSGVHS